jgi:hypothetical protein
MAQRLDRAARHCSNEIKKKLSLAGTGSAAYAHEREEIAGAYRTGKLFTLKVHYRKRQRIYGFVRSKPGEPPRKQTGLLRRSVAYETDKDTLTARVGVGGPPVAEGHSYAVWLELGTRKMAMRPYIRTTMFEQSGNVARILEGRGPEEIIGLESGVNLEAGLANLESTPLKGTRIPPV